VPLPTPVTAAGVAGLAAIVGSPEQALLAFDFDGVLSPIVSDPQRAFAEPRAVDALCRLAPHLGALAVITGRPAAVAVALGGFAQRPELAGLVVFGQYGRERWDARTGETVGPPPSEAVAAARAELPAVLSTVDGGATAWVEDKGAAVAVHTRRSPDPAGIFARLTEPVTALAQRHGLTVEPGRFVLELRPAGVHKGHALESYVEQTGLASVGYTGDDLGDLPAFAAVDALRARGRSGLKVCSGSAEVVALAEQADLVVDGPGGVADLLEALAAELSTGDRHDV
jgi:trehalose 6-phosphate phosphatase